MNIDQFYRQLWQHYLSITPQAGIIQALFQKKYGTFKNDHVAFRTFDLSPFCINDIEPFLLSLGYRYDQRYFFKEKKLNARSYLPQDAKHPRLFISELCCEKLSEYLQDCIYSTLESVDTAFSYETLFNRDRLWPMLDYSNYLKIRSESEYAAWLLVWGFRANHFTISVNSLRGNPCIQDVADVLQEKGFDLNVQGGIIKGEKKDCLQQISTLAQKCVVEFASGDKHLVPGCYYEFAMRYPTECGELFEGFVTGNADKIFESTNSVVRK